MRDFPLYVIFLIRDLTFILKMCGSPTGQSAAQRSAAQRSAEQISGAEERSAAPQRSAAQDHKKQKNTWEKQKQQKRKKTNFKLVWLMGKAKNKRKKKDVQTSLAMGPWPD